jgi:hypothetical protein
MGNGDVERQEITKNEERRGELLVVLIERVKKEIEKDGGDRCGVDF